MVPPTIPPVSPYGTFTGTLFQYARNLVAFESQPPAREVKRACIMIGGLSDGLIPTPYCKMLETNVHSLGWSFVQPILSSSYLGFGSGNLGRDTNEICELMHYLSCHRSIESFALVGHSTGCQNSVHFLKHGAKEMIDKTKVVVLQAPVSDREQPMAEPDYAKNIQTARELVSTGKGKEMMPRSVFWAPITAQRFLDLQDVGGEDDFFSSDFTQEQLVERLGHVGTCSDTPSNPLKVLVAYSGSDEYVPSHVDTKDLTQRLVRAMNHFCKNEVATALYLETANHNVSEGPGDAKRFVEEVSSLLKQVSS